MRIAPADYFYRRVAAARRLVSERQLDALIVTHLPNIAYLTGFFGTAGAVVLTRDEVHLVGDARYRESLRVRGIECEFVAITELVAGASYDETLVALLRDRAASQVAFEAAHLSVSRHHYLSRALQETPQVRALVATEGLIEELRARKDAWEIARLREGGERLSAVAEGILPKVFAGRTEAEVAADIESRLRWAGFERAAFDTIVASGPNAALPHARAGHRRLEEGDLVVIDFGGVLDGYCTDMTRTVAIGSASPSSRRWLDAVAEAQRSAFAAVVDGGAPEQVDFAARDVLRRYGLDEAFTHGTGHGLGLEVHEAPRVTRARPDRAEPPLAAGMVLTIEPGVYFSGTGGVRLEDDVLVTSEGAEWLTGTAVR
jgi:Xaa-Pro aminopeptidase